MDVQPYDEACERVVTIDDRAVSSMKPVGKTRQHVSIVEPHSVLLPLSSKFVEYAAAASRLLDLKY